MLKTFKKVASFAKKNKQIGLVYIFGSSVNGGLNEPRDVDIGIYLAKELSADKRFEFQMAMMDKFEKLFGRRADVVILNTSSPFIKHQVIKYGKLVFERKKELANKFCFNTMTEYFDAVVLQNFFYSQIKRSWAHG